MKLTGVRLGRRERLWRPTSRTIPVHGDALADEEAFGTWSNLDLVKGGLTAALLGLATVALGLGREPFALLYAAQIGLTLVIVGTTRYVVDQRLRARGSRLDGPAAASALFALWLLFVFLPVVGAWTGQGPRGHIGLVIAAVRDADFKVLSLLALLAALAVAQARSHARHPDPPGATFAKPLLRRVISVAAFVFFGPKVFSFFAARGAPQPVAMAATFALAESYPFVATFLDRFIHREHRVPRVRLPIGLFARLKGSPPGDREP